MVIDHDTTVFLLATFVSSYILEFVIVYLYLTGNRTLANLAMIVLIFIPSIAAGLMINFVRREDPALYGINIGSLRLILVAYLYPLFLIIFTGSVLYAVGFPIDWSLVKFKRELLSIALREGVSPSSLYTFMILSSLISPFLNAFFTVGEEIGWRGYLYTKLIKSNSLESTLMFIGIIWALWHAPLIILVGYNYPNLRAWGVLLFMPFCIAHGTILVWLRDRSGGIALPSIGHAAMNSFVWFGYALYPEATEITNLVLGLPGIIVSSFVAYIFYWDLKRKKKLDNVELLPKDVPQVRILLGSPEVVSNN